MLELLEIFLFFFPSVYSAGNDVTLSYASLYFFSSALSFSGGIMSSCRHNWLLIEKRTTCRPTNTFYNDQTKVLTVIKVSLILHHFPHQSETCGGL